MSKLSQLADKFENITKIAIIRKLPDGEYGVFSHKGKNMGKYKTKEEAKKRLQQIEFFKHKKKSSSADLSPMSDRDVYFDDEEAPATLRSQEMPTDNIDSGVRQQSDTVVKSIVSDTIAVLKEIALKCDISDYTGAEDLLSDVALNISSLESAIMRKIDRG